MRIARPEDTATLERERHAGAAIGAPNDFSRHCED